MNLKNGVFTRVTMVINGVETIVDTSPQIRQAMHIADSVSKELTGKAITVTSILDGKHKSNSRHYSGNAFDIRTFSYTKEQISLLLTALKKALGKDYDVIFEINHIHFEYDPK